ncbi:hypothetical protein HY844_01070 [Candidatus Berkelbacteria bacterium]|nr:hypothetical protein [Candidatus Berkelbacteria bacterium]
MKIKSFIFAIFTLTLLALTTFVTILFNTKPNAVDILIIFYTSILLTISGSIFLLRLFFAYMRENDLPSWSSITTFLRLSLVIAFYSTLALYLQSVKILSTAVVMALLLSAVFTEVLLKRKFNKIK